MVTYGTALFGYNTYLQYPVSVIFRLVNPNTTATQVEAIYVVKQGIFQLSFSILVITETTNYLEFGSVSYCGTAADFYITCTVKYTTTNVHVEVGAPSPPTIQIFIH